MTKKSFSPFNETKERKQLTKHKKWHWKKLKCQSNLVLPSNFLACQSRLWAIQKISENQQSKVSPELLARDSSLF